MSLIAKLPGKARKSGALMIVRSARTTTALILREMSSTYGRTPGGYIWAVLEPIGMIVLLSLAFSLIVRAPAIGTSFVMFYATGYLPFTLYNSTSNKIEGALRYSKALLSYPSVLWIDAIMARFTLNLLTSATVFCIVMSAIITFTNGSIYVDIIPIIIGITFASLIGLGIGMVNIVLGGLYPVWLNFWAILSRPLFLASGVLFIYEDMPNSVQNILWWNPIIHVSGLIRMGFYSTYNPAYISLTYLFGFSLVMIVSGLIFIGPNYQKILEK